MRDLFPARRIYPSDQAILAMFRSGQDTSEIANRWFIPEAYVWNAVNWEREAELRHAEMWGQ